MSLIEAPHLCLPLVGNTPPSVWAVSLTRDLSLSRMHLILLVREMGISNPALPQRRWCVCAGKHCVSCHVIFQAQAERASTHLTPKELL